MQRLLYANAVQAASAAAHGGSVTPWSPSTSPWASSSWSWRAWSRRSLEAGPLETDRPRPSSNSSGSGWTWRWTRSKSSRLTRTGSSSRAPRWSRLTGLSLLLALWPILGNVAGCCSEPIPPHRVPDPLLPAGRPPDRGPDFVARQDLGLWRDDPGPDGWPNTLDDTTTLPALDLDDLLADRAEWKAYAEALENQGRWRR